MVSSLTRQWFLAINITCKLAMTNNTFYALGCLEPFSKYFCLYMFLFQFLQFF